MGNLINIYTLQKSVGLVGGEKEEGVENNSLGSFLGGEMNSNIGNQWTKFRESTLGKTRNYICGVQIPQVDCVDLNLLSSCSCHPYGLIN